MASCLMKRMNKSRYVQQSSLDTNSKQALKVFCKHILILFPVSGSFKSISCLYQRINDPSYLYGYGRYHCINEILLQISIYYAVLQKKK